MVVNSVIWRKSSYSSSNGGECVEVGGYHGRVLVRDTKDQEGPVLRVSPAGWRRFADRVKSGRPLAADPRSARRTSAGYLCEQVRCRPGHG
jgi:Domain of unknown function (DUF397)